MTIAGSYGEVCRGQWRGTDVAIKTFHEGLSDTILKDFETEVSLLSSLRHPNILLFIGASVQGSRLSIVTELMPRGSLFDILHKSSDEIDPRRRLRMALDIARGVNQLHSCNPPIVHRDLKSPNLLVAADWKLKVADVSYTHLS